MCFEWRIEYMSCLCVHSEGNLIENCGMKDHHDAMGTHRHVAFKTTTLPGSCENCARTGEPPTARLHHQVEGPRSGLRSIDFPKKNAASQYKEEMQKAYQEAQKIFNERAQQELTSLEPPVKVFEATDFKESAGKPDCVHQYVVTFWRKGVDIGSPFVVKLVICAKEGCDFRV
ncbi:hypothetical protein BJ508DRAFT_315313 [Ascobolus immersus RN42]|uniref:Uncharacterized protein n=1 Tax=Ascobolus immersus RN42 TaxID=1160509 RepID=A0A3N4HDP9_ASCIM|nr:hypothetical protein BJ508DRAFT_315313 [Ascobolus immersus RN42]